MRDFRRHAVAHKPDVLSSLYYAHGLFCASYPITVVCFAGVVVFMCSLPYFVTWTGGLNTPKPWRSSWLNYRVPTTDTVLSTGADWLIQDDHHFSKGIPSWFTGLPVAVVQQLHVDVVINCTKASQLCSKSSYGTSRLVASYLLDQLQDAESICRPVMHPAATKLHHSLTSQEPGPGHASLHFTGILSPVLDTMVWNSTGDTIADRALKELLYGGFWEHQRTSTTSLLPGDTKSLLFTVTFLLQPTSISFSNFTSCVSHLQSQWTLPPNEGTTSINHFYYEAEWTLVEFAPLLCLYFIVFLYITFSVGKIDLVKSKWGLGFTAVVTVLASLIMSLGICTLFGLSLSVNGSEIYPYGFVLLGLENILIVVKAVMSTPAELGHVKYRIAAGLFKEGRAITMNLITQVVMFTSGIITFNYTMKEFCVVALVGVLCDFFLQVVFFPTVLSIDMRRLELIDLRSSSMTTPPSTGDTMEGIAQSAPPSPSSPGPRRLQLFYFLAKAKFLQRALTVAFIASVAHWCYNSKSFHAIVGTLTHSSYQPDKMASSTNEVNLPLSLPYSSLADGSSPSNKQESVYLKDLLSLVEGKPLILRTTIDGLAVQCGDEGDLCWRAMVSDHWPRLLRHYGYPVKSRFITLLQPISLSLQLGFSSPQPEHRNSDDDDVYGFIISKLLWPYLARGLFSVATVGSITAYFILLSVSTWNRRARSQKRVEKRLVHSKPSALKGHKQEVECLAVCNGALYSASLDGSVRVWNPSPLAKKCVLTIDRSKILAQNYKTSSEEKTLNKPHQQPPPIELHSYVPQESPLCTRPVRSLSLGAINDICNVPLSTEPATSGQLSPRVATPASCVWTVGVSPAAQSVRKVSVPLVYNASPLECVGGRGLELPHPNVLSPHSTGPNSLSMRSSSGAQATPIAAPNLSLAAAVSDETSPLHSPIAPETAPGLVSAPGYDFGRHFNLFSPYTSNLALEYSTQSQICSDEPLAPAVWCLDVWNNIIAVGCGCGQIEIWNACSGLCSSCVNFNTSGTTVIAINQYGILAGHMDGNLHLISHDGKLQHTVQAHSRPVGVMKCCADKVITGGYDTLIQAHHVLSLSPLFSIQLHTGSISSLCVDQHSSDGCLSGCTNGLVCYWELSTGNCLYEFENSGAAVLKLVAVDGYFVGLFSDECIRTWDRHQGQLVCKIQLDGLCQGFAATGVTQIAASVESHIVIYDVSTGKECGCQELDLQGKGAMLIRNITALDSGSIVFSAGCDLHIVPCIKMKTD